MTLSIVIVSYQVRNYLADCIRSIQKFAGSLSYEIIVVDNHSTDGTIEMLAAQFSEVIVIANDTNLGFAKATNQGILKGKGRNVLLLNPDTVFFDKSLQGMIHFAESTQDLGSLGCKILNDDFSLQSSCRNFPNLQIAFLEMLGLHNIRVIQNTDYLRTWDHEAMRVVDTMKGACLLVPRKIFDSVGLLDEKFFLYGEELDLCKRIHDSGLSNYFNPEFRIIHYGEKSSEVNSLFSLIELHKAEVLYFRKYFGATQVMLLKMIKITGLIVRTVLNLLLSCIKRKHRKNHIKKANQFGAVLAWYFINPKF